MTGEQVKCDASKRGEEAVAAPSNIDGDENGDEAECG